MKNSLKRKMVIVPLCLLFAASFLTGCSSPEQNSSNATDQTRQSKETAQSETEESTEEPPQTRKYFTSQLASLKKQYEKDQEDQTAALNYAQTLFSLGDTAKAKEVVTPLVNESNPAPEALYLAAEANYLTGDYEAAETHYTRLLKEHKEDYGMQAEAGLQMVYYQTNQYSKAKDLFAGQKKNENPILDMMKAFVNDQPNKVKWNGAEKTTIPFLDDDRSVFIPIEVNGVKMNAFVDTGASGLSIDQNRAEELGIESVSEAEGEFAGGQTNKIGFGKTDSLKLGDVELTNVPTMLSTFDSWDELDNSKKVGNIDAIIGTNVLQQFVPTIDFLSKELVLIPRSEAAPSKSNAVKVPFTMAATHYIFGKGTVNGLNGLNLFADSGFVSESNEAGVNLTKETLELAKIPMPELKDADIAGLGGDDYKEGVFNTDSYGYDGLFKKNAQGLYETGDVMDMYPVTGFIADGMIGYNYLKDYRWTLDFDAMEMSFQQ